MLTASQDCLNSAKTCFVSQLKRILYADDDVDDKTWVVETCKALRFSLKLEFVENGRQALEYLASHSHDELPSLIVLDLNMPEMDGRQTLQRIKANEKYKDIPVIIVTTSSSKADIETCKRLGATLYLIKPDTYADWQNIIKQFVPFIA
jgi:CheY-like chemotaxis protein